MPLPHIGQSLTQRPIACPSRHTHAHCVVWVSLACVLLLHVLLANASYDDYDDSKDDFWRDAPPKLRPKKKVDPQTGQRLVATTFRLFQARLKPNRLRMPESTSQLVEELNELFVQEGMSHNRASASATHVIVIQSRDEWDELKDVVFSLPDIYDVTARQGVYVRPGADTPYGVLWRAEMAEGVPEPLAPQQPPAPASRGAASGGPGKKKKGKGRKGKNKGSKSGGGSGAIETLEL